MSNVESTPKIIVAADVPSFSQAEKLVLQLDPSLCRLKVGKELFTAEGMRVVDMMHANGFSVFLDLKFHDIPNTVAAAVAVAARAGVWMVNVHASGGKAMMVAAKQAVENEGGKTQLIAVTVLTSAGQSELQQIGVTRSVEEQVLSLARLAQSSGLSGVVCSAQEAPLLRQHLGEDFVLVTPGIRPVGSDKGDQNRIVTPKQALENGSSYLVIGRPITQAQDPSKALKEIAAEL